MQQQRRGHEQRKPDAEQAALRGEVEAGREAEAEDVGTLEGELTGIAVKWSRLLDTNCLLRQENARLRATLAAAEAEAERLRGQLGSSGQQRLSAAPVASQPEHRRQQRQSEPAVAAAAGVAPAEQKEEKSSPSLPTPDLLFSILFDARRQPQAEEKAPALAGAQAVAVSAAEEGKAEPAHKRPELLSMSTDRMVMELDDLVAPQPAEQPQQQQQSDAQRSEASRSDAAVEHRARGAESAADIDPFATQELARAMGSAVHSELPSSDWPAEEEVRRRLQEAREQRQRGSEVYRRQQEVQEALSIYQAADRLLSCSVSPSSPQFAAFQTEQALLLASRAVLLVKLSRWSDAAADVGRLLLLRPRWWKSFSLRARVLSGEQRLEQALAAYEQALQCEMTEAERQNTRDKMDKLEKRIRLRRGAEQQRRPALRDDREEQPTALHMPPFPALPAGLQSGPSVAAPRPLSPPPASLASAFPLLAPLSPPARMESLPQRLQLSPPSSPPVSSSAPLRSSQDYSVLPRITLEGVRDLLGVELFHWAEESVDNVYQLKLKREQDEDGSDAVVVRARCWKEQRWRKRRRLEDGGAAQQAGDERRPLLELMIGFQGNRTSCWSCSCYAAVEEVMTQQQQPEQDTQDDDDDDGGFAPSTPPAAAADAVVPSPYGVIDHSLIPCRHIGATLLLIRRKQTTHASAASASAPTLFVHPSRVLSPAAVAAMPVLCTQYGQMKMEALRQLLSLNGQSGSGVKDELVERCVEGRLRGVLGKCDRCGGSLFYAAGRVHCKGRFDVNTRQRTVCGRHWPDEALQRRQWREH